MYPEADRSLLSRYVTNTDGDVYAIHNLPEEVIAVIFAYVSRSPRSFRDNLLELVRGGSLDLSQVPAESLPDSHREAREKARRFHEKWVVGYGHSSVAEHAVAHVGVERISRLASAELELCNPYLSFTEYSQRYQRPQPGGYVVPEELNAPGLASLRQEFTAYCDFAFETYQRLQAGLLDHLLAQEPEVAGEKPAARRVRLEKLSFEDARYALPLAVHTNLGVTGNGRALRDGLVRLLASPSPEVRSLAAALRTEVSRVLPALLRHAEPTPYWQEQLAALQVPAAWREVAAANMSGVSGVAGPAGIADDVEVAGAAVGARPGEARLLAYTGRQAGSNAALQAMRRVLAAWLVRRGVSWEEAQARLDRLSGEAVTDLYGQAAGSFGEYDQPSEELKQVRYEAAFTISEANWHQLLRHSRKIDFYPGSPETGRGYTVPPRLAAAGLTGPLEEAVERAERLVNRLKDAVPGAAPYAVTNAHRRYVLARFDLWEWVHLSRLRCKPEAQWDIRETMWSLMDQIRAVHGPLLDPLHLPSRRP